MRAQALRVETRAVECGNGGGQRRIVGGERDPALIEDIPFDQMGERAPWPWRGVAIGLYTNWMAGVPDRSE